MTVFVCVCVCVGVRVSLNFMYLWGYSICDFLLFLICLCIYLEGLREGIKSSVSNGSLSGHDLELILQHVKHDG
jgi:hypothetical protein